MAKDKSVVSSENRIKNWMSLCRVLFYVTLLPWFFFLFFLPMMYDMQNQMTLEEINHANRIVWLYLTYPVVGLMIIGIGSLLYSKGKIVLGIFLTSVPTVVVYGSIFSLIILSFLLGAQN